MLLRLSDAFRLFLLAVLSATGISYAINLLALSTTPQNINRTMHGQTLPTGELRQLTFDLARSPYGPNKDINLSGNLKSAIKIICAKLQIG